MSTPLPLLDSGSVRRLAQQSAAVTSDCACTLTDTSAWAATPLSFPEHLLKDVGTLLADPYDEPSFREYHPAGTRYDSPEAPIALQYFPYNRCQLAVCTHCGRHYLRYTEAGGYFVERRLRSLSRPDLVVDACP